MLRKVGEQMKMNNDRLREEGKQRRVVTRVVEGERRRSEGRDKLSGV